MHICMLSTAEILHLHGQSKKLYQALSPVGVCVGLVVGAVVGLLQRENEGKV